MKNSWMKRVIAVLLCLAVFAVSELSGVTNVVRDLYAEEMDDGSEASEDADSRAKVDNEDKAEEVQEVELEPSEEESQPEDAPEAEISEGEADTDTEAETEPGSETTDPDNTETAEGEAADGENKDSAELEAGDEGTQTPAGTEDPASEQETISEGQLAKDKDGESEVTAAAVTPEEKPEPILKLVNDEDDNITVTVEAEKAGIIPDGASLSVTPIEKKEVTDDMEDEEKAKTEEINAQYDLTAEKLKEASEEREDDIVGFLAYDICLTDQDGNKTSPDGEVKVTLAYKEAAIPEELKDTETKDAEVTVMHLEEDEDGEVKKAVDLADKVEDIKTTGSQEVETTEFVTDSSDIYAIAWTGEVGVYTYENDEVVITVSEETEGAIPAGSRLSVKPIVASEETKEQYQEVAQKLQEKAENENYEIAGFLAYDITLIDKDGNKIEPNGGVKVTMDYKQAVIPEDLKDTVPTSDSLADKNDTDSTEPAESAKSSSEKEDERSENSTGQSEVATGNITVMHLEENDQGQVTKVVDMGAEGKVTELNSTKDQKVTSTEFVTESFSAFTIVWKNDGSSQEQSIDVKFYDTEGNEIELADTSDFSIKLTDNPPNPEDKNSKFLIDDIKEGGERAKFHRITDKKGQIYTFNKACVYRQDSTTKKWTETQILGFKFDWGNLGYIDTTGVHNRLEDYSLPSLEFRFLYNEGTKDVNQLETVDTIDNNDYGITMRMINYDEHHLQEELMGVPTRAGGWWDEQGATQGIVRRRLENGYPVMTTKEEGALDGTKEGNNLSLLFGGVKDDSQVEITEANRLFLKDKYEDTGYFEYSSFQNYAYMNEDGQFTVYKGIGATEYEDDEYFPFYRGNFFPYNDITPGKFTYKNFNKYGTGGEEDVLSEDDPRKYEKLYLVKNPDYCFGMYIEAAFAQPQGGMVEHNGEKSSMEYRFTGDDDLWVFIDDSLVLDIGGAHHACSGSINFSTGEVKVDGKTTTNVKEMFKKSGYFPDGREWKDSEADHYFDGNTFKDYSTHRIKMFYMEHGKTAIDNASNLQVKMNLPTINIPTGTVKVKKQLDNTDKEKYTDVKFAFQMFVQKKTGANEAGDVYSDTEYEALDVKDLKDENGKAIECNIEKKIFYLKPDQVAVFENLQSNRKYYVKETGVESELYDKVTIKGGPIIEEIDSSGESTFSEGVESSRLSVEARPGITFSNKCSAANSKELRITKKISNGQSANENDRFTFKVTLAGKTYDGPYYLTDSEGNYYKEINGTLENQGKKAVICKENSPDGVISNIPAGYTVSITQIMSGTTFKVEEINPETDNYKLVSITGDDGTYEAVGDKGADSKYLEGKILLGQNAKVTVTNALKNVQNSGLRITKRLKEGFPETDDSFEFTVFQMKGGELEVYKGTYSVESEGESAQSKDTKDGKISIKANETAVIEMPAETEFKVEETLSEDYGIPEIRVTENTAVNVKVDKETVEGTVFKENYADITVTNILAYSYDWQIVKKGTTKDSKPLEGAEFTLKGETTIYYGKSQKDSGVIQWFEDVSHKNVVNISSIAPGEYELKETKAPAGYRLSNETWTIKLDAKSMEINEVPTPPPGSKGARSTYEYTFLNEALYELPSTGGIGTHWYTIGGTLLMMAGMLILYRNKKRYAGRC